MYVHTYIETHACISTYVASYHVICTEVYVSSYIPSAELGQLTTAVDSASVHGQYKLHTESRSELHPSSKSQQ